MKDINYTKLFEEFSKQNILVIGDVMVDSYLWGKVNRISPEAPVPIVTFTKRENRLGGAANVALNIHAMGATPYICSIIGNDERGNLFKDLLQQKNLSDEGIITTAGRPTTVKTRIISGKQQLLRVDQETDQQLDEKTEKELTQRITNILKNQDIHALIFQDYDKGSISPALIKHVTTLARSMNVPTLVDPKKRNFEYYRNVTLFKPNFKEMSEGLNMDLDKKDYDSIFNGSKLIHKNQDIDLVMITLSEQGIFISNGISYHTIPAEVRDVADVSGAGDTVISVAGLCLAMELDPEQIAFMANMAGGLVCEKVGVVPVNKEQLLKELNSFTK